MGDVRRHAKVVCVGERTKVGNVIFSCGSNRVGGDGGDMFTHMLECLAACVCMGARVQPMRERVPPLCVCVCVRG